MAKQIGYAVVGIGDIAQHAVLPAFASATENSRLVAIVSGDRAKAQAVAQEYRAAAYHYDEFRQCLQRDDVNAVYIALPNSMHSDYAVEAARAGVHVLCEKPMAVMADECRRMIRTCQTNRVKLMVGYRLHFQPAHLRILELVRAGAIGPVKTFSSDFTIQVEEPDDIRLQRRLGGGSVYDLGVYCINTSRLVFAAEPAQVMAMTARASRRLGGDVDESTVALIRFPDDRLAHFHTSFGEEPTAVLTIFGEQGFIRLHGAYLYDASMRMELVRKGQGEESTFEPTDQFAGELVYFSDCILQDRVPEPSGLEGLQDVRIVEAIYRSARDGRPVTLPRISKADAPPSADQEMRKPLADRRQAG
ncbi:MAG TPA: Gfo/Idh/MocA family oxidoreductase [Methylomirabilota bacterium]|jgi:glucose-fructose oxidoreductase|nr:Gfo/Idh/MocA family oxidoreductase [Methylomirabilota bacterium]